MLNCALGTEQTLFATRLLWRGVPIDQDVSEYIQKCAKAGDSRSVHASVWEYLNSVGTVAVQMDDDDVFEQFPNRNGGVFVGFRHTNWQSGTDQIHNWFTYWSSIASVIAGRLMLNLSVLWRFEDLRQI